MSKEPRAMATSESASETIIRRYAAAMNLGPAHTVLFLAASVAVTCVFLAPQIGRAHV